MRLSWRILPWHTGDSGKSSGTIAADETGNYPGTYVGNPALGVPGVVDNNSAVDFEGISNQGVRSTPPILTGSFTVEAWVKLGSLSPDFTGKGIVTVDDAVAQRGWDIQQRMSVFRFLIGSGGGLACARDSVAQAVLGSWVHVVGVFESLSNCDIFIDGVISNAALTGTIPAAHGLSTADAVIGNFNALSVANALNGNVDEVAIYPVALSATRNRRPLCSSNHLTPPAGRTEATNVLADNQID